MSVPDQITATGAKMFIMVSHYIFFFIISIQHLLNRFLLNAKEKAEVISPPSL